MTIEEFEGFDAVYPALFDDRNTFIKNREHSLSDQSSLAPPGGREVRWHPVRRGSRMMNPSVMTDSLCPERLRGMKHYLCPFVF